VERLRGWPAERIVVKRAGHEPRIAPALIKEVALTWRTRSGRHVHGVSSDGNAREMFDPNLVKVVIIRRERAVLQPAPIPWARDAFQDRDTVRGPGANCRSTDIASMPTLRLSARLRSLAAPALKRSRHWSSAGPVDGHRNQRRGDEFGTRSGVDTPRLEMPAHLRRHGVSRAELGSGYQRFPRLAV